MSGAARRRLASLKKKSQSELTEEDKKFVEYAEHNLKLREEYLKKLQKASTAIETSETTPASTLFRKTSKINSKSSIYFRIFTSVS
jgi:recombinational DNA repair ATPase RecF